MEKMIIFVFFFIKIFLISFYCIFVEDSDEEFVWDDYLADTGSVATPSDVFAHVEASLECGLQNGMKVEICNSDRPKNPVSTPSDTTTRDTSYWVATIVMSAGQLLRLRYVGNEDDTSLDFWKDINHVDLQPLGWCGNHGKLLQPHPCTCTMGA